MTIFAWLLLCLAVIQYSASEERSSLSARHSIAVLTAVLAEIRDDTFDWSSYTHTPINSLFSTQSPSTFHSTYSNISTELGWETDDRSETRRSRRSSQSEVDRLQGEVNRLQDAHKAAEKARDEVANEVTEAINANITAKEAYDKAVKEANSLKTTYDGSLDYQKLLSKKTKKAIIKEITAEEKVEEAEAKHTEEVDKYEEEVIEHLLLVKDIPTLRRDKTDKETQLNKLKQDLSEIIKSLNNYETNIAEQNIKKVTYEREIKREKDMIEYEPIHSAAVLNRTPLQTAIDNAISSLDTINTQDDKIRSFAIVLAPGKTGPLEFTGKSVQDCIVTFAKTLRKAELPSASKKEKKRAEDINACLEALEAIDKTRKIDEFVKEYPAMKAKSYISVLVATEAKELAEAAKIKNEKNINDAKLFLPNDETMKAEWVRAAQAAREAQTKLQGAIDKAKEELAAMERKHLKPEGDLPQWKQMQLDFESKIATDEPLFKGADEALKTAVQKVNAHKEKLTRMDAFNKNLAQQLNTIKNNLITAEAASIKAMKNERLEIGKPALRKQEWEAAERLVQPLLDDYNRASAYTTKKKSDAFNALSAIGPSSVALQNAKNELAQAILQKTMNDKDAAERRKLLNVVFGIFGGFLLLSLPIIIGVIFYVRHRRMRRRQREQIIAAGGNPDMLYNGYKTVDYNYDPEVPEVNGLHARVYMTDTNGLKQEHIACDDKDIDYIFHKPDPELHSISNRDPEDLSLIWRQIMEPDASPDPPVDLQKIGVEIDLLRDPKTGEANVKCDVYPENGAEAKKYKEPTEWDKQKELFSEIEKQWFRISVMNKYDGDCIDRDKFLYTGGDEDDNVTLANDRIVMNPHMLEKEDWTKEKRERKKQERATKLQVPVEALHDSHKTHDKWREYRKKKYEKRVASDESNALLLDPPDEELETTFVV